jgi:hypothetical protein
VTRHSSISLGEDWLSWLGGLWWAACSVLRAAQPLLPRAAWAVEFSRGEGGPRLAVWLLTLLRR